MTSTVPQWPRLDCLGVCVGQPTWDQLREWFLAAISPDVSGTGPRLLFLVNAHTLNMAHEDASYRAMLNQGDVVLNDGFGLELFGHIAGRPFHDNFNGTDLIPRLLAAASDGLTVFLYGARPGRAERAASVLKQSFPGIRILGAVDGYRDRPPIDEIAAARPQLLLVGLGNPAQETWINANRHLLDARVVVGVGALIDFLSGEVRRAPTVMRRARLEWLFRLAREPRRLFTRYVIGNPLFVARSLAYVFAHRKEGL